MFWENSEREAIKKGFEDEYNLGIWETSNNFDPFPETFIFHSRFPNSFWKFINFHNRKYSQKELPRCYVRVYFMIDKTNEIISHSQGAGMEKSWKDKQFIMLR